MTIPSITSDHWSAWSAARHRPLVVHLDHAASSRSSTAVLDAVTAYARDEAEQGAYVVAERRGDEMAALREQLADLLGVDTEGVALVEGAESALTAALRIAPIEPGDTVVVAPSEWGPNLAAFAAAGLQIHLADVDAEGCFDVAALDRLLAGRRVAFVHVTPQASHRALRQPTAAILECCRRHGVALWVDAAQTVGHDAIPPGADVVYGTSRKWLAGPRGVGFLGVGAAARERLRFDRVPPSLRPGADPLDPIESHEAHHAGRIGLLRAIEEYRAAGTDAVHARLTAVGQAVRAAVADVPGWRSLDPVDAPGAICALAPTAGQDVFAVRRRLIDEHAIVTTAGATARAPHEMTAPTLRVSPHVDLDDTALAALVTALTAIS